MPTSSQYSGQSSPLWPFGHDFSMTIFSVFGVFTKKLPNLVDCPCLSTLLEAIATFETSPMGDPFLKEAFVFLGQTDCRGLYDMLSEKQHRQQ